MNVIGQDLCDLRKDDIFPMGAEAFIVIGMPCERTARPLVPGPRQLDP